MQRSGFGDGSGTGGTALQHAQHSPCCLEYQPRRQFWIGLDSQIRVQSSGLGVGLLGILEVHGSGSATAMVVRRVRNRVSSFMVQKIALTMVRQCIKCKEVRGVKYQRPANGMSAPRIACAT